MTLVAAAFSLLMAMVVCDQCLIYSIQRALSVQYILFLFRAQGVGRFILKRVESFFMSKCGVKSLLKREGLVGGVFSNLFFVVPEATPQKTVTDVEMNSVATGNPGSFQKFDDIQGMTIYLCFYFCEQCFS